MNVPKNYSRSGAVSPHVCREYLESPAMKSSFLRVTASHLDTFGYPGPERGKGIPNWVSSISWPLREATDNGTFQFSVQNASRIHKLESEVGMVLDKAWNWWIIFEVEEIEPLMV